MAKMYYSYGTMKSGKSQEYIRVYYNYKLKGDNTLLLTSAIDNRSGVGKVTSRNGSELPAIPISSLQDLIDIRNESTDYQCVLIDEAQFMSKEMIKYLKEEFVLNLNIPVLIYGLKTDFMNELFEGSYASFIYADEIKEIKTVCQFCGSKATMNLRMNNGKPIKEGEQILIGDDEYIQVCNKHWNDPKAA